MRAACWRFSVWEAPKSAITTRPIKTGVQRLMTSGLKISVSVDRVTGRAYLKDGGYDDQVYEKAGPGDWRAKSSTHVPAATP